MVRSLAVAGIALAAAAATTPAAAQGRWGNGDGRYSSDGRDGGGYDGGGYGRAPGGARPLFTWNGRVDREAYVVMQSGDVRTRIDGYDNGAGGRARVMSALPQTDGVIDVRMEEGRGRVDVVEQPTSRNGYRAVVRVRDDDAGAGNYRLVALWRPAGGYGYGGGYPGGFDGRSGDGRSGDGRYGDGRYGDGRYGDGRYGDGRDGDGRYGDRRPGDGRYRNGGSDGGTYAGSGVLHWRGRVDDVAEIRIQGGRVDTRTVSGQGAADVRSQFSGGALPPRDVAVRVNDRAGRGRVVVVQQPHPWNGYTAVVRVEDREAGAGWYDFDVSW
ncbi:MAG TPA: hypothetical protein VGD56_10820 [Gemmatirosa sp.]